MKKKFFCKENKQILTIFAKLNNVIMEIEQILFLDIETVSIMPSYFDLNERMRKLWDKKATTIAKKEEDTPENLYKKAAIYAEFGKIVCISVAYIQKGNLRVTSFANEDEKTLLLQFAEMLNKYYNGTNHYLCAHNGKEFDFPYICRRMLINRIKIPNILNVQGKKPWETTFLDTMELWKFGDYKHYTSLDVLAAIFNIPSPKDDIDGSQVNDVFWQEHNLKKIRTYCEKDVVTIVQIMLCYLGENIIEDKNIIYINAI